jgi:hypothetical protein
MAIVILLLLKQYHQQPLPKTMAILNWGDNRTLRIFRQVGGNNWPTN